MDRTITREHNGATYTARAYRHGEAHATVTVHRNGELIQREMIGPFGFGIDCEREASRALAYLIPPPIADDDFRDIIIA